MTHPSQWMRTIGTTHPDASSTKAGYVLRRADMEWERIADLNGNPADDGWVHRLADPEATGDPGCEFAAGIYHMEPHWRHPLHVHRSAAELYYVVDGVALFTVGDEEVEAGKGTAVYIPSGMPHAISSTESSMELLYAFAVPDLSRIGTEWLEDAPAAGGHADGDGVASAGAD